MIPPVFRAVDVTSEKPVDHGDLHLCRFIECICMSAMLLSVVSGSHAANQGIRKAPYPPLRIRGCCALIIKLYAAGLPAYTVYLLTSILSVSAFYQFILSHFSFFSQNSLTKVSLETAHHRSEIKLQLFSGISEGIRIGHHIVLLIFQKSQSEQYDCSSFVSVDSRFRKACRFFYFLD